MKASEVREKYLKFFEKRGHKRIPPSPLVLENDTSTLFTSAGMQPLVPYLVGEPHPKGKKLTNSQPSIRLGDIEEVGDNRHTTFFEMLGNWSLGDYFKKEQLSWILEFFTNELGISKERLWVSVFEGSKDVPRDTESFEIWKKLGIPQERIVYYGAKKNWWSMTGTPEEMQVGQIGGPDSEVFFDFGEELKLHENSPFKNQKCHPNCDCGRFLEIGNSVFIQYKKVTDKELEELPNKNVDFGGGLERITAAVNDDPDIFKTDIFSEALRVLQAINKSNVNYDSNPSPYRIILDHLRAAAFLVNAGITPSNKEQGYVLRRLIRKAMVASRELGMEGDEWLSNTLPSIVVPYRNIYPNLVKNTPKINETITEEVDRFRKTINKGLSELEKTSLVIEDISTAVSMELEEMGDFQKVVKFLERNRFPRNIKLLLTKQGLIDGFVIEEQRDLLNHLIHIATEAGMSTSFLLDDQQKEIFKPTPDDIKKIKDVLDYFKNHKITLNSKWVFRYITTYGVPLEILRELANKHNIDIDVSELDKLYEEHRNLSRTTSAGVFKGGLADHSPEVVKLHTATHLLLASLRKVLGDEVVQKGQNITPERARFDFPHPQKLSEEEFKKVEDLINETIKKDLPVNFKILTKDEAIKTGAVHAFNEKYADTVKVYYVGESIEDAFSKEFCGGPHVSRTGEIGRVRITKQEKIGAGLMRVYAVVNSEIKTQKSK